MAGCLGNGCLRGSMKKEQQLGSIGVCVHATGQYLAYAQALLRSLEQYGFPGQVLHFYVFTDRCAEVERWKTDSRVSVCAIPTEHRPWPESTILRFGDYARHRSAIAGDLLLFLDADMELRNDVGPGLLPRTWPGGIALVRHPGFYEPPQAQRCSIFRRAVKALRSRGSWETSPASLAFLEESKHRVYVCGGSWMGINEAALDLCELLASRISRDTQNGVVAVWHDESHLNWWAAHHPCQLLTPEYCFVDGYDHLQGLVPRIVALEKPADFVRAVKG